MTYEERNASLTIRLPGSLLTELDRRTKEARDHAKLLNSWRTPSRTDIVLQLIGLGISECDKRQLDLG